MTTEPEAALPFEWACPQCGLAGRTSLVDVRCECGTVSPSSGAHFHTKACDPVTGVCDTTA